MDHGLVGTDIRTDQIRVNPSNPCHPWSIHPSDAINTGLGHYPTNVYDELNM